MSKPRVVVTFDPSPEMRDAVQGLLAPLATVTFLSELGEHERAEALTAAQALLAWGIGTELRGEEEFAALRSLSFIQLLSAGADHVPFERLPDGITIASNAGAYSEPIAEHVVAMALALAKRLPQNHAAMSRGEFDQHTPSATIHGSIVAVLGFGGIGRASARLFRALGARVHAINRSGASEEPVDWIGSLDGLDVVLRTADIVVVSLPLTHATRGLLGERELRLMKPSAILVNVARAAIIDEDALYEHLRANPGFSAGIDTWWEEPRGAEAFTPRRPFFELPNLLGSPHNSGITAGALTAATRAAAENLARGLRGEPVHGLVDRAEYVD